MFTAKAINNTPELVTRSKFLTWVEHMTQPWDVYAPMNRNARKSSIFIYIPVTSIVYLTFMHSPWLTESPAVFLQLCDVSSHNLNSKYEMPDVCTVLQHCELCKKKKKKIYQE